MGQGHHMERTLLLVDDEERIRKALVRLLRGEGYRVLVAASGAEGLEILAREKVDVILSDQRMPGMTGTAFFRQVRERYPNIVRIALSACADTVTMLDAINQGAVYKFIVKPWEDELLRAYVREAFEHVELINERARLAQVRGEADRRQRGIGAYWDDGEEKLR